MLRLRLEKKMLQVKSMKTICEIHCVRSVDGVQVPVLVQLLPVPYLYEVQVLGASGTYSTRFGVWQKKKPGNLLRIVIPV